LALHLKKILAKSFRSPGSPTTKQHLTNTVKTTKVFQSPQLPSVVATEISEAIEAALGAISTTSSGQFVVNDSAWYARKRRGGTARCVINSASFLSSKFQRNLELRAGWHGEYRLDGQNIDGYAEIKARGHAFMLPKRKLVELLEAYMTQLEVDESLIGQMFTMFYGMYVARGLFTLEGIPTNLRHYFTEVAFDSPFRVGVEFETGNIASSFRAFQKLNTLFARGHIDAGVFVTAIDKASCATRIWPATNRNGSFQELVNRNYRDSLIYPSVDYGFAPDGFDATARYLGEDGKTFLPASTGKTEVREGTTYEVWVGNNSDEILKAD
jgi:hypothetical protein